MSYIDYNKLTIAAIQKTWSIGKSCILLLKAFKAIFALTLFLIFVYLIIQSYHKLQSKEMTFSSSTEVEEVFTHPSITLCITMDNNFTNGFANKEWLEAYKYEFPFPYPDLGNINDNFLRYVHLFAKFWLGHNKTITKTTQLSIITLAKANLNMSCFLVKIYSLPIQLQFLDQKINN